ncbi:DUF423 domain-containing protein [Nubsella zeaxanthinifaciens]|jgi:uncharacterized membrane protein YgdD (TMEM256/DUF423 family)|uniref:DUF423 domain-containing protein n=1 Tax=Nubsella zeaxanthinifaciens TaxID=392412 RepID=UPI000DE42327|nr:DUF423 domain-containing protein [Nubsella zeaxanthinifaciens]
MGNNTIIFTGTTFGILAIILGAFGAHALKKVLSTEKLASFEVGVRYQMYNALFLLLLGFNTNTTISNIKWAFYLVTAGTILFSFSIYLLALAEPLKKNFRFLGPVTPLGGLLIILGWGSLLATLL